MSSLVVQDIDINEYMDKIVMFLKEHYHINDISKDVIRIEEFKEVENKVIVSVSFRILENIQENFKNVLTFDQFLDIKNKTEEKFKTFEFKNNFISAVYNSL